MFLMSLFYGSVDEDALLYSAFPSIDRFQSRDHFTIGRHIGAHVNSELVSREL